MDSSVRRIAIVAALFGAGWVSCVEAPQRVVPVGRRVFRFEDPNRRHYTKDTPRPLLTHSWYPTTTDAKETPWNIGVFRMGWAAEDAPLPSVAKRRPLVVLSHGTGGAASQLSWLAEALATQGFMVAAVNHHGNTAAEPAYLPHGFALWWERPRDLSVLIDRLLADEKFALNIDPTRIGVVGFSLGGYTALALGGVRIDRQRWMSFCKSAPNDANCRLPPEAPFTEADIEALEQSDVGYQRSLKRSNASYADPRIRAIAAIAPAMGRAIAAGSLGQVRIPTRLFVGSLDEQVPPDLVKTMAAGIVQAHLTILPNAAHYTFLAECTWRGRWFVPLCHEPGGANRAAVHDDVASAIVEFLQATL